MLLESLARRRADQKINSEDLFGAASPAKTDRSLHYLSPAVPESRLEVLLQEKEALGLYVSGNPLEDYRQLAAWLRQVTYRDDIYLVVLNKIRKIFTKKGHMMFALELSTCEGEFEGIIFPKKALDFSTVLQEKALFLVCGKLDKKDHKTVAKVSEDGEVQEYDELPKILIDNLVPFAKGLPELLVSDDATTSSLTFQRNVAGLDWAELAQNPAKLFAPQTSPKTNPSPASVSSSNKPSGVAPVVLRLTKNLGLERIKHLKTRLQRIPQPGLEPVAIEIEHGSGEFKRAKGKFWLDSQTIQKLAARR